MPFNCDLIFSYSNKREYVGQFNFRNTLNMQVQRAFDATASAEGSPAGMPPLLTGIYTGIIVNGVDFGTGRVVSFSNPTSFDITEDGRHLWKQEVSFEVRTSGDSGNFGTNNAFIGLSGAYVPMLESLDESFSFDISQDGGFQYTHSAAVKCLDEFSGAGQSGFITARNICSGLLASAPPLGYIDAVHSGFYTGIGRRTYSETIDKLNGTASFEEQFLIQSRDFIKHSVSFDNGFISVTENGLLRNSGSFVSDNVFSGNPLGINTRYSDLFASAYTRCNSLWTTYMSILGTAPYTSALSTQPSQITKAFDETSQEFSYSVTYTNNPIMTAGGYSIDREISYSQTLAGITECTEQASLVAYANKGAGLRAFLVSAIASEIAGAYTRTQEYWISPAACKKISETRSVSTMGKRASYSATYSNDPSFVNDGTFLTKTTNYQDNGAILMHAPYLIIGRKTPLMHNPGQTQFGSASCTISATLPKPLGYYAPTPVKPAALEQMFVSSLNSLLQLVSIHTPLDMFISKVAYSYTSDMTAELTTEAQYVYARTTKV